MRIKEKIEREIKSKTGELDHIIDESVEMEQSYEEESKRLREEIKVLKEEKPFEETHAGKAWKLTTDVKDKIRILLDELAQVTGVELEFNLYSKQKGHTGDMSMIIQDVINRAEWYDKDVLRITWDKNDIVNKRKEVKVGK